MRGGKTERDGGIESERKRPGQMERITRKTDTQSKRMLRIVTCVSVCWLACEHQLSSGDSVTDRRGEQRDPDTNPW